MIVHGEAPSATESTSAVVQTHDRAADGEMSPICEVKLLGMHDHAGVDRPDRLGLPLGELARRRRLALRLRQEELAELAGVSTRTVHAIENGKPTIRLDVLLAVLEVLGVILTASSPTESVDVR